MRHPIVVFLGVLALVAVIIFSCVGTIGFLTGNGIVKVTMPKVIMPNDIQPSEAVVVPTRTLPISVIPGEEPSVPTAIVPQEGVLPTATAVAPIEAPFNGLTINVCPTASLGKNPDHPDKDLIFKLNPYPGDPEVLCEFEAFSVTQDIKLIPNAGGANIMADWLHGYQWDANGELVDECQEADKIAAPECEGTWVQTGTVIIPKGDLVHVYVYAHEAPARVRFTHTISWTSPTPGSMKPFACQYIGTTFKTDDGRTIVHSQDSIRVPAWATDAGTIYEFNRTLPNPLQCPAGFTTP